jgi:hypothetical protein
MDTISNQGVVTVSNTLPYLCKANETTFREHNFSYIIFKPRTSWCNSASNRNEYQESFLGVKTAGAYGWQPYHLHVPIV